MCLMRLQILMYCSLELASFLGAVSICLYLIHMYKSVEGKKCVTCKKRGKKLCGIRKIKNYYIITFLCCCSLNQIDEMLSLE